MSKTFRVHLEFRIYVRKSEGTIDLLWVFMLVLFARLPYAARQLALVHACGLLQSFTQHSLVAEQEQPL